MLMCRLPLPFSMSESRLLRPLSRFWPPLVSVSRSTSGLVSAKFDGESASTYWRVKNATFFSDSAGMPSTLATACWIWREAIR